MNIKRLLILTGVVLLGLTLVSIWMLFLSAPPETAHAAGPWYVAPGGSDSNSCLSTAAPCATINGAIGKATGGDTIFVATGTYTGTGDEVVLIDKDITLSGGWDDTFTTQSGTSTIDGEDVRRGIHMNSDLTATVEYFTVQHGYTDDGNGGGIYNSGNLTLTNSTISDSFAYFDGYFGHGGGGIYNIGSLNLIKSTVSNNTATDGGGGIYATNGSSTVIVESQIFANASSNWEGGGIQIHQGSNLSMSRSWVIGNAAASNDGGGIGVNEGGTIYIENSIIAGNYTDGTGGGLWLSGGKIINSHIIGNEANSSGAALAANIEQVEITNTLIISNVGSSGIGSQSGEDTIVLLSYCDTFGNSPDGTFGVTITRTNCLGTPPEDGLDPMMAGGALPSGVGPDYADEWLSYDYRLLAGSPAIDAGTSVDAPATDIDGTPRDATPDMGAYEWKNRIFLPVVTR